MNPETVGPYRILESLRPGGLSSVYKAAAPNGTLVALKVFSPQILAADTAPEATPAAPAIIDRFLREVRAVIPLTHPNILQVIEAGQDGPRFYLATELFAGVSLERLLAARRLTLQQSIAVMRGLCRGLAFAHERGFVHGHLSPRHVLVADDTGGSAGGGGVGGGAIGGIGGIGGIGAVKIADFGPSEIDVASELDTTLRTGAYALGSYHYRAPEQMERSEVAADPRSDLYAAGVLFFEMLTGRPPSGRFTLPSQANAELPPATDVLLLRCLDRDPQRRYPSANALLADLDRLEEEMRVRLLSQLRGLARLLGAPGSARRKLLLAATALLLAALVVALVLLNR